MVAMLARFDLELIMASVVLHTLILPYRLPLTHSHLFLLTADHWKSSAQNTNTTWQHAH